MINRFQIFIYSFAFSFSLLLIFLFWIQNPFFVFEDTKKYFYLSIVLIIILSIMFSLLFMIIISVNTSIPIFYIIPIIFIVYEYIISVFYYGFPWISFSLIISSNEFALALIKYIGTFMMSYLIIQIYCLPYLIFKSNNINIYIKTYSILFLLPFVCLLLYFFVFKENNNYNSEEINLEIVQLNLSNHLTQYDKEESLLQIKNYIINSNSDILIFGENNYPYLVDKLNIKEIQNILKDNQTVIIGATRFENGNYFNTLLNINSTNVSNFDKKILVPFGEFLPFRKFLSKFDFISGPNDYSYGNQRRLIHINNNINYIPVICYEIIFYWKLLNKLNRNSNLIINITNDIWFGKLLGPYQHFYFTKIRAAEFNKPLVRVSNNGISGIIGSNGKALIVTNLNKIENVRYTLKLNNKNNFYSIHYFLKLYFIFIVLFIFLINFVKKNGS